MPQRTAPSWSASAPSLIYNGRWAGHRNMVPKGIVRVLYMSFGLTIFKRVL